MESILITPTNKSDLQFLSQVLERLGIPSKILSKEEMEDAGLALLMKSVDRSKKVNRAEIMKKLKS
jgi:hypothetical protein